MNLSNIVQVQNVNNKLRQSRRYEKSYNNYIVKSDSEFYNFYFYNSEMEKRLSITPESYLTRCPNPQNRETTVSNPLMWRRPDKLITLSHRRVISS